MHASHKPGQAPAGCVMNRPTGDELLGIGRRTLLDKLLPLLPDEKTYDVLMIANAMAIAARELAAGRQPGDGVADFLRTVGARDATAGEAGLAALIRRRDIHPSHNASLHALLLTLTQSRLALSNPKYIRHEATDHGQ